VLGDLKEAFTTSITTLRDDDRRDTGGRGWRPLRQPGQRASHPTCRRDYRKACWCVASLLPL